MASIIAVLSTIGSSIASATSSVGGIGSLLGAGLTAAGTIYGGVQANKAAGVEAKSLKKKGDAEFAIGQEKARRARQEKEQLLSRQRAVAAAGGGGMGSETSTGAIMGRTEIEGNNNALMEMYNGTTLRDDLYHESAVTKAEGKSKLTGSFIDAGTGIYSAVSESWRKKKEAAYG